MTKMIPKWSQIGPPKILNGLKGIYPAEICILTSCLAVINRWRCDRWNLPIWNSHLGPGKVARA
jgi:hypothetical protein